MEVGDKRVHRLELISRGNKNIGHSASCVHDTVVIGYAFKRSAARSADGDYSAAAPPCGIYPLRRFIGAAVIFGVHMVILNVFDRYRPERS